MRLILVFGLVAGLAMANASAESFLMPKGATGNDDKGKQPFEENPVASNSLTRKVLTYGVDADGNKVPTKTLRITNNTGGTVYPVMRDPNSNTLEKNNAIGMYDPYDAPHKEYRGYIGYTGEDGQRYFGLKKGESILVSIPLVFWNGARIGIGTDGKYLATTSIPNPLRYDPNSVRAIAPAETSADTIKNGVVMWYRAEIAQAPNDDTEDQLAEWTIRDHVYLNNPAITKASNGEIPDNQLVTLINYDVSNVDNLYLPLAMQALDAWVMPQASGAGPTPNRTQWTPGSEPDVFGWTGAINDVDFLQEQIHAFTKNPNELLGQYFGGKGWPVYNIPNPNNDPDMPLKIPSGANIFAQSPIKAVPSSYGTGKWEDDKYMLSSGGSGAISATIASSGKPDLAGSLTLNLSPNEDAKKMAFVAEGYYVTSNLPPGKSDPIQKGTSVVSVDPGSRTVTLNKKLVGSTEGIAFTFTRPTNDYASNAMIKLWYSWAQYYQNHWKDKNPGAPTTAKKIKGSMEQWSATMNFDEKHPELVAGMAVTGPGLDEAMTENGKHQGEAVILKIASDEKSALLSQVANSPSTKGEYSFSPPQKLLWTPVKEGDPGYPLIENFSFSNEPKAQDPYAFAQQVYLIMASMNQIGRPNNDSVSKFMQDVVGANMGFIFTQAGKDSDDGKVVTSHIRDMVKSVLRGVTDFTEFPDEIDAKGKHTQWYPDPATPRGGQKFNVFNLDPFVWFVHVRLGFSGYGFSVDDDTADVGAGGANHLQLSVTGTNGLKNTKAWSIQAPFGPVGPIACEYSGPDKGDSAYEAIKSVSSTTPITVTTTGQHNLQNGDTVVIDQVVGNPAANGTFKVGHAMKNTFDLLTMDGQPAATKSGDAAKPNQGRWSYPLRPYIDSGLPLSKVFHRVDGDDAMRTFQGAIVSVAGIPTKHGEEVRVWRKGDSSKGRLILNKKLTNADGSSLPAGTYQFTFSGEL